MALRSILLLTVLCAGSLCAQPTDGTTSRYTFLPGRTIFPPLPASFEEARAGITKDVNTAQMKLDIGTAMDFLEIRLRADSSERLRVGADLFTYALTTSYQGLRLQVDAVDGYFGGHIVYRVQRAGTALLLRLRILHLSSHLLDGHFDSNRNVWIDGKLPTPLARDYGEITLGHLWQWKSSEIFLYGGFSQATLIRPPTMKRLNLLWGITAHTGDWAGTCFGAPVHFYASDHCSFWGLETLSGTNMVQVGAKFGEWQGAGISIFISHHAGLEVYHQYFDVKNDAWGLGVGLEP